VELKYFNIFDRLEVHFADLKYRLFALFVPDGLKQARGKASIAYRKTNRSWIFLSQAIE
jgi:hypothetical protein